MSRSKREQCQKCMRQSDLERTKTGLHVGCGGRIERMDGAA